MGIAHSDFRLFGIQLAMFGTALSDFNASLILGSILSGGLAERFDGPVQALPLPAEAPPELPRVILQSSDSQFRVTAALNRIDSHWTRIDDSAHSIDDVRNLVFAPLEKFIKTVRPSIGRWAFIITRTANVTDAAEQLASHFCRKELREGALCRSDSFELHNHKAFDMEITAQQKWRVNSWVRCRAAKNPQTQGGQISLEQDINSLNEELMQRRFSLEEIVNFFAASAREVQTISELYFPGS